MPLKMKKHLNTLIVCCLSAVAWAAFAAYSDGSSIFLGKSLGHPAIEAIIKSGASPNDTLSLITEPDDGTAPVISLIAGAKRSVHLVMYTLNDKKVEAALAAARGRGVAVRVLLNGGYKGIEPPSKKNTTTYKRLTEHGVEVGWTRAYFDLTHQKTLSVDGERALIMTGNLDRAYYKKDRDFQVLDTDPADVAAIEAAFASDWNGDQETASDGTDLVWSPGSEGELIALIKSAKDSLLVYNEEMADDDITNALENAARQGVNVEILMSMETGWLSAFTALTASGVHIRTFGPKAPIYIHAKMILADGKLAFLGSENFSNASMNANRELGLMFSKVAVVGQLISQFHSDWEKASPFP